MLSVVTLFYFKKLIIGRSDSHCSDSLNPTDEKKFGPIVHSPRFRLFGHRSPGRLSAAGRILKNIFFLTTPY